jgi:hypothetical protein
MPSVDGSCGGFSEDKKEKLKRLREERGSKKRKEEYKTIVNTFLEAVGREHSGQSLEESLRALQFNGYEKINKDAKIAILRIGSSWSGATTGTMKYAIEYPSKYSYPREIKQCRKATLIESLCYFSKPENIGEFVRYILEGENELLLENKVFRTTNEDGRNTIGVTPYETYPREYDKRTNNCNSIAVVEVRDA